MTTAALIALWLFVFSVPWENAIMLEGIGSLAKAAGIIAAPIAAIAVIFGNRLRFNGFIIAFGLFVVQAMLSIYWSSPASVESTWLRIQIYFQIMIMIILLYQFLDTPARVASFLRAYILGAAVAAISTVQAYYQGVTITYQRFSGVNFDPNDLSIILALALPMAWYLAMVERRWMDLCLLSYVPLGTFAILLTASRAGAVAAAVAAATPILIGGRVGIVGRISLILVIGGVSILCLEIVPETSLDRIVTLFDELNRGTLNNRTVIWVKGWELFAQNPWIGIGAANFRDAVFGNAPHNVFLAIAVEQGLVGLFLLSSGLALALRDVARMPGLEGMVWYVVFAILTVGLVSLNWEWRKQMWIILLLASVHAEAVARQRGAGGHAARAGAPASNDRAVSGEAHA